MRACRPPARQRAFTLIEILAVAAIVAVVAGLIVVRLDVSESRRLESAAESLLRRLETARDEAVVRGRALAFSSDGQGYQFWIADATKDGWLTLADAALVSGGIGRGVGLRAMRINGMPRPLGEKLVFSISGISEPFVLTLAAGEATLGIEGDALGRMEIRHAP